jgi:hypothetical protein
VLLFSPDDIIALTQPRVRQQDFFIRLCVCGGGGCASVRACVYVYYAHSLMHI